jgi:hypothetical protein
MCHGATPVVASDWEERALSGIAKDEGDAQKTGGSKQEAHSLDGTQKALPLTDLLAPTRRTFSDRGISLFNRCR